MDARKSIFHEWMLLILYSVWEARKEQDPVKVVQNPARLGPSFHGLRRRVLRQMTATDFDIRKKHGHTTTRTNMSKSHESLFLHFVPLWKRPWIISKNKTIEWPLPSFSFRDASSPFGRQRLSSPLTRNMTTRTWMSLHHESILLPFFLMWSYIERDCLKSIFFKSQWSLIAGVLSVITRPPAGAGEGSAPWVVNVSAVASSGDG